ncbi:DNA repair protein RadA [Desulfitibacter alkalitolerans]|uniref:DNA repair protein RadA n=1 Tax=Desulfitibacter alkalitolerans TaxID=264641 RepID=UPI0004853888|nr:DNA repair protein RadA [Desulfitibacter alkalitolerans]
MKTKTVYVCSECKQESSKWHGRCLNCNSWNTLEETLLDNKKKSTTNRKRASSMRLSEVISGSSHRIVTGMNEFNRVVGGGIVRDSITILTAKPGAGKSTLLLQIANDLGSQGYVVMYASGEESESQIKCRADRIFDEVNENVWVISDTSLDNVLASIETIDPDLIIIDSIQTFVLEAFPGSRAGSPTQTMECAGELLKIAKNPQRPRAVIMVGQMTKEDELAGLRALEHLVDTVMLIEGESGEELKTLTSTKNRHGGTMEMGFLTLGERGMVSIDNPSEYFMTKREDGTEVSGSALAVMKEGTRPIIIEVESLVSSSFTPYPLRIGEALRKEQMNTLISILEQRGGVNLYDKNVVIKITGGIKIKEQAANLAVIMSIASSVFKQPIPNHVVFVSDVGLTGELKKVPSLEVRVKELDRMGFKKVFVAKDSSKNLRIGNIEIIEAQNLQEVLKGVFKIL